MTVADRIRYLREKQGLTQEELATRMGYNGKSSISKIETSGDAITLKKITKLAEVLNTSEAFLMGWIDNPDPKYADTLEGKSEELQSKLSVVENAVVGDVDEFQSITSSMTKDELVSAVRLFEDIQRAPEHIRKTIEDLLEVARSQP